MYWFKLVDFVGGDTDKSLYSVRTPTKASIRCGHRQKPLFGADTDKSLFSVGTPTKASIRCGHRQKPLSPTFQVPKPEISTVLNQDQIELRKYGLQFQKSKQFVNQILNIDYSKANLLFFANSC